MNNLPKKLTKFLLLVTIASCTQKLSPTTQSLPPSTQTGTNTFGCMVGNNLAYTSGEYNWLYLEGVYYKLWKDSTLEIFAITQNPRRDFTFICKLKNNLIGTFNANLFNSGGYSNLNIDGGSNPSGSNYYQSIDSLQSTITISKFSGDITKGAKTGDIISGTFDMMMQNSNGQKLHLTSGRFDISYVN